MSEVRTRLEHSDATASEHTAAIRDGLLTLHATLIDDARRTYEASNGRQSHGAFLEALVNRAELRWLGPLTSLVIGFESGEYQAPQIAAAFRALLSGEDEFATHYAQALQRSPDVVLAHAALMRTLPGIAHTLH